MSSQGWSDQAWDNKWDGFPTASVNTYNRADGTVTFPFDWFNAGPENSITNYNRFSPEPLNQWIINPYSNQATTGCAIPVNPPDEKNQRIALIKKVVDGEMEYLMFPEESKYLDEKFVFNALSEDTLLRDSLPEFRYFYDFLRTTNLDKFHEIDQLYLKGRVNDALSLLDLILIETDIEYNKQYTCELGFEKNLAEQSNFSPEEEEQLTSIAYTNAWEGGEGVFSARHLLEEQVFDLERNLRKRNPEQSFLDDSFSFYPNPAQESIRIFYTGETTNDLFVKFFDMTGRILLEQKPNLNSINISELPNGLYIMKLFKNNSLIATSKITVLK